jgi:hypothetical protein
MILKKMEECTIHMGQTVAHCHSGTMGRGLATWPKLAAFASPCRPGTARACATCIQCALACGHHGRTPDLAQCSPTKRWQTFGTGVGEIVHRAQPLRCYTRTYSWWQKLNGAKRGGRCLVGDGVGEEVLQLQIRERDVRHPL